MGLGNKNFISKLKLHSALWCVVAILVGCGQTHSDITVKNEELKTDVMDEYEGVDEIDTALEDSITTVTDMTDAEAVTDTEHMADEDALGEELDETEEEEIPDTVNIRMVGDILLHTGVETSACDEEGGYNFDAIFANTKEYIEAADLAIVNEEVILGGEELGISGYPCFNGPYEVAEALSNAGFDVVCHATNHALDKGKQGLLNTIGNWDNYNDMEAIGIHESEEDSKEIYITEINGIKIAVLNYTYGTNGIPLPSDMPYCVDLLEEDKVRSDIRLAEENADFTIVCPHWGTEYRLEKDSMQSKWTDIFFSEGVDLVIGTHPHVIEPYEMIEDENHKMLVYYSLGNFVNWTSGTGSGAGRRMVGGMADVTLGKNDSGEAFIEDYGVIALVTHLDEGYGGVTTYSVADYTEELGDANLMRNQDSEFDYHYVIDLCDSVWDSDWK